jgi:hypothetical protein
MRIIVGLYAWFCIAVLLLAGNAWFFVAVLAGGIVLPAGWLAVTLFRGH